MGTTWLGARRVRSVTLSAVESALLWPPGSGVTYHGDIPDPLQGLVSALPHAPHAYPITHRFCCVSNTVPVGFPELSADSAFSSHSPWPKTGGKSEKLGKLVAGVGGRGTVWVVQLH